MPAVIAISVPKLAASSEARIGRPAVRSSATIRSDPDWPKINRKLSSVGFFGHQVRSAPEACHSAIGLNAIEIIQIVGTSDSARNAKIAA